VPIVVVSGLMDEALARDAFAHGAFDYVVKPVDMRRLAEVVDIALLLGGSGAADG
jgi:FixJ family two-component response regulator